MDTLQNIVVFGSVGGGGRYDGLVSRFRSEPVPATGFSIGVSRMANALKLTGNLDAEEPLGPVVVLVLDRDQTARYQAIVSRLWFALECRISSSRRFTGKSGLWGVRATVERVVAWVRVRSRTRANARG